MTRLVRQFWTNLAVGVLGLLVGIDNLLRWTDDASATRSLVIGALCTLLSAAWLTFVLLARSKDDAAQR